MKVLLINKYNYLKGGADTVFFNTIELLNKNGNYTIPFCTQNNKNFSSPYDSYFTYAPEIRELKGIKKISSIKRFFINNDASRKIEELVLAERPDIAHLHNIFNGISLSILPILKKYNIPIVITMHDTRFICPSSYFNLKGDKCRTCLKKAGLNCGIYKCYQDSLINSWMCALEMLHKEKLFKYDSYIDKYIFVSNRYKYFHSQIHPYFKEKGEVLYNFLPNLKNINLGAPKKGEYIFYYGRITIEKGISTLVEAMKDLPNVKLKVAGTGNLLDSLKYKNLKNVDFLGFKSGEELFSEVRNASFIIVPSEWEENNPLTIIESYAYGKPVIGTRIGGIPEIIEDGKTGFICNPFDKDDLVKTIKSALEKSNNEYIMLSKNARDFAELHFDGDKHYEKLIDIYEQAIKNKQK